MSPQEDLEPDSDSSSPFTFESDIYAFAMTLVEVRIEIYHIYYY